MPAPNRVPKWMRQCFYEMTVSEILEHLNLEVSHGEKVRIGQLAADSMRLIMGIAPVKVRNKIVYTPKTIPCIYRALDLVIPDWRE